MVIQIAPELHSFSSFLAKRRSSTFAFLASFKSARRPSRSYRVISAHPLPTLYEINPSSDTWNKTWRWSTIRRNRTGLFRRRVIIAERMRDRSIFRPRRINRACWANSTNIYLFVVRSLRISFPFRFWLGGRAIRRSRKWAQKCSAKKSDRIFFVR